MSFGSVCLCFEVQGWLITRCGKSLETSVARAVISHLLPLQTPPPALSLSGEDHFSCLRGKVLSQERPCPHSPLVRLPTQVSAFVQSALRVDILCHPPQPTSPPTVVFSLGTSSVFISSWIVLINIQIRCNCYQKGNPTANPQGFFPFLCFCQNASETPVPLHLFYFEFTLVRLSVIFH